LIRAERIWRLQRGTGNLAMVALALALLVLLDGLRGGVFGESGQVALVPGESYAISGPMPPKTDRIEDFVVEGNAFDDSVRLVPDAIFTGYWFGGGMWRGRLVVDSHPKVGVYVLKVRDRFGEKQNPALVFTVRVYADEKRRRADSPSAVMRWTSLEPFLLAPLLAAIGLGAVGANYLLGRRWNALLAEHGCGEVFRLRKVADRLEAEVEMKCEAHIAPGVPYRFTHPLRGDLGRGEVVSCRKGELTIVLSPDVPVRLGDIVCPVDA